MGAQVLLPAVFPLVESMTADSSSAAYEEGPLPLDSSLFRQVIQQQFELQRRELITLFATESPNIAASIVNSITPLLARRVTGAGMDAKFQGDSPASAGGSFMPWLSSDQQVASQSPCDSTERAFADLSLVNLHIDTSSQISPVRSEVSPKTSKIAPMQEMVKVSKNRSWSDIQMSFTPATVGAIAEDDEGTPLSSNFSHSPPKRLFARGQASNSLSLVVSQTETHSDGEESITFRKRVLRCLKSHVSEYAIALLILANAATIGLQADYVIEILEANFLNTSYL